MAWQTEILNLLVQAQQNQQCQQSRGRDESQMATYQEFLSTQLWQNQPELYRLKYASPQ
jgi:hypothetical protein